MAEFQPVDTYDDVLRALTNSYWSVNSGYLIVGYANATGKQYGAGMRFPGITIPQGTTILTAFLTVTANPSLTEGSVNSRISAEKVDNAPTFADDAATFDARWANRTAQVNWDAIPAWTEGVAYNSPSIVAVIQEIINRAGWVSGNALVLFWEDFENRSTQANNTYRSASATSGAYAVQKLTITFTSATGGGLHYIDNLSNERYIRGTLIGASTMPKGNLAVVDTELHYIDQVEGFERYIQGTLIGASSMPKGNLAVVDTELHYIGNDGNEYYREGTLIGASTMTKGNIAVKA